MLAALRDHATPPWRPGELPPLGHFLLFPPDAPQSKIGMDGHPAREDDGLSPADVGGQPHPLPGAGSVGQRRVAVVMRINTQWRDIIADLDAAARPGVTALMVPGCAHVGRLATLAEMLAELEAERGVPHRSAWRSGRRICRWTWAWRRRLNCSTCRRGRSPLQRTSVAERARRLIASTTG